VAKLEQIGIKVSDVKGNFLPLVDILQQLYERMKPLGDLQRSELLQQLLQGSGGTIQARRFIDQVLQPGEFEQFMGFLQDMNNATGQFQNAYSTMASTTANRTQLLKNRFEVLKVTVGEVLTPAFNNFIDVVSNLINKFNQLDPATQSWIVKSAAVAGGFSVLAGSAALAASAIGYVSTGLAALGIEVAPAIAIVLGVAAAIAAIGYAFVQLYRHSAEFRDFWKTVIDQVKTAWSMLKDTAEKIKQDYTDRLSYAFLRLKVAIDDAGSTFDGWYQKYIKKHEKDLKELLNWLEQIASEGFLAISWTIEHMLIPAITKLTELYKEHEKGINQVIGFITWLGKEFEKFASSTLLGIVVGAIIAVIVLFYAIVTTINEVIQAVSAVSHAISIFIGWIKDLIGWIRNIPDPLTLVKNAFTSMKDSALNAINSLLDTARSIPGKIQSAVGSLGSILYNAGRNVINGLIDGIRDSIPSLGSVLSGIAGFIASHKGPREKDLKLLVPAGMAIMQGLISGIQSMVPSLNNQLQGVSAGIAPQVIGSQSGVGPTRSLVQNITVNQADRSARQLALELGFELAGSI
jgi:phage-related protein